MCVFAFLTTRFNNVLRHPHVDAIGSLYGIPAGVFDVRGYVCRAMELALRGFNGPLTMTYDV